MLAENAISFELSGPEKKAIATALSTIESTLESYLIALTIEQRKTLPKMNDGTLPFVEKVMDYAESNPEFVPPYVDKNELKKDLKAREDLQHIGRKIAQLNTLLDDTTLLAGSEAYSASLSYYQSVKQAAKMNIPDAKTIYKDLQKRFDRSPAPNPEPQPAIEIAED